MTKDEALDLALEALEKSLPRLAPYGEQDWLDSRAAITAIKQARAAPVQKPYRPLQDNGSQYFGDSWDTPTAQPAPEVCCGEYKTCLKPCTPRGEFLAAQRPFVGLTDEEIMGMYNEPRSDAEMIAFGREVEAELKEKNT